MCRMKSKRSTSGAAAKAAPARNNGGYLGSEGQPLRISAWFQQDVAFPLVCGEGLRGDAASRSETSRRSEEAPLPRRSLGDRHRAHGEQDAHQHLISRPGIIIGRKGAEVDKLRHE